MDLLTYLERTGTAEGVNPSTAGRIRDALEAGTPFSTLAAQKDFGLPPRVLLDIAEAHFAFQQRLERIAPLEASVPAALLDQAMEPHEVHALQRITTRLPESRWDGAYSLWQRAFALALKDGEVRIDGTPGKGFDEYLLKREILQDMAPHRWLRIRRGERSGALNVRFSLPISGIQSQGELLQAPVDEISDLLETLPWDLRRYQDHRAEREAIRAARSTYEGLLTTTPVDRFPVLAVAVGRGIGIAILDEDGTVVHHEVQRRDDAVLPIARAHAAQSVVLPTRSSNQARLARLKASLEKTLPVTQVLPAGLSLAAEGLDFPRIVASSIILGRRAISPLQ